MLAVFAPLARAVRVQRRIVGQDPVQAMLDPPSSHHWFGTTYGREDVLSQVIYGAQTALEVIILAVVISIVIGVPLGLISGYFGGWLDRVLVLITDALFAFPSLLLAIVVRGLGRTGLGQQVRRHPRGGHLDHRRLRPAVLPRRAQRDAGGARGDLRRGRPCARRLTPRGHDALRLRQRRPDRAGHRDHQRRRRDPDPGRARLPRLRHRALVRRRVGVRTEPGGVRRRGRHLVDRPVPRPRDRAHRRRCHAGRREPQRRAQPAAADEETAQRGAPEAAGKVNE